MNEHDENDERTHRSYATITDDGVNYRDIAGTMTILGYPMNHSSARNRVLRIMRTFVEELSKRWDIRVKNERCIDIIARSASFQDGVADVLRALWDGPERAQLFTDDVRKDDVHKEETEDHAGEPAAPTQHDASTVHR